MAKKAYKKDGINFEFEDGLADKLKEVGVDIEKELDSIVEEQKRKDKSVDNNGGDQ